MDWIKVCNEKSLRDGDLVGFDYHDNNHKKKYHCICLLIN